VAPTEHVEAVVGGVSELYQGDLDLGRLAVERLAGEDLGSGVLVEDFHYGGVAVAQRLEDLRPAALVLVGAHARGRPPGSVERRRLDPPVLDPVDAAAAVADAVQGYVAIDLVVEVAAALHVLPQRTVAIEVEPAVTDVGEHLSPEAAEGLEEALRLVRAELRRLPLLRLADELRAMLSDGHLAPSPALDALEDLLAELEVVDREGRWGRTLAERDRLRLRIADGLAGEGMTHLDWGLWWALIEELDRIQGVEAV
jgi:Ni,Fe-hydrogenase maturation factor